LSGGHLVYRLAGVLSHHFYLISCFLDWMIEIDFSVSLMHVRGILP